MIELMFRHEQCQAYNGNNFKIEGLPDDVKWVPKYTGSKWFYNTVISTEAGDKVFESGFFFSRGFEAY